MLKETANSLRQYFGLFGVLLIFLNAYSLRPSPVGQQGPILALIVAGLVIGGFFLYFAITLPSLLKNGIILIKGVLIARLLVATLDFLLAHKNSLIEGFLPLIVSVALCLYLFEAVNGLAATREGAAPQ